MWAEHQIATERARQQTLYSNEHDDTHSDGELRKAAECYLRVGKGERVQAVINIWPFAYEDFKPYEPRTHCGEASVDRKKCHVKAAALISAEIDRLYRLRAAITMYLDTEFPEVLEQSKVHSAPPAVTPAIKRMDEDVPF